jgi:hypothetical protein
MIYWEKSNAYKYKIETSKNNTTWNLSVDMTGNTIVTSTIFHNLKDTARYVRITITGGVNSSNWASFFEFMLYDGSFTVDSQKNVASKGNDGDMNTFWRAGDNIPGHSWVVDLGSKINITGTQVTWIDSLNGYKYKIETSSDSSVWSLAVDKTTNTSKQQTQTDNFNDFARYVRITITGSTSYLYNPGFLEFKVFDGTYTTFSPASVTINCVKPLCVSCKTDSMHLKPWINVNNSGWMQSGSAYLCLGDDVSFNTFSSDTTGWIWNGPSGYSANKMQINLSNIQLKDTGIYRATHNSKFFNFYLKLIKDSIYPFIKVNKGTFLPVDTATVKTGDTISLSPLPPDSIGWNWSWTGPHAFSSTSRVVKFLITDTTQAGIYKSIGTDAFNCGSTSQIFHLTVNKSTGIADIVSFQNFKIYPNPSNGTFILKDCINDQISIYNLMGEKVYSKIASSNNQIIDLSTQAKGIYVIKLLINNNYSFKKLVIQ